MHVAALSALNFPTVQESQIKDFSNWAYLPALQTRHATAALVSEAVPTAQEMHSICCEAGWYVPGSQAKQLV